MDAYAWLLAKGDAEPRPIVKDTVVTRAWFATVDGRDVFAKAYPPALVATWARVEAEISGGVLHPAIVPLRAWVDCDDGALLVYDHVEGESLGPQDLRTRFAALPLSERKAAVLTAIEAVAAVHAASFMVVDWYEGNMIYDFDARRLWLFDWELCRRGEGFTLEMDANYGSSRLMAPEEHVRGSRLDGRTLVFNLGRYALLNLPEMAVPLADVLSRATHPDPAGRFQSPREFARALDEALRSDRP